MMIVLPHTHVLVRQWATAVFDIAAASSVPVIDVLHIVLQHTTFCMLSYL